ncbi:MAG: methylated-DNA--[protein]-cysteine S-methyltransferase [Tannerellaceae bacterium]|nr:methylated-DNA--[protein]-cysteine S-methyltransferase [Tannerellaceae bacterium]
METFDKDVYSIVEQIPCGQVITYGWIARLAGFPAHARRVGYALKHIPAGKYIPAHRVVNSAGRLAPGWPEQKELLLAEGVNFRKNGCVDLESCLWKGLSGELFE